MSRAAQRHALRFYTAVAFGVVAVSATVVLRGTPEERRAAAAETDAAIADWCAGGFEPIAGGGCYARPQETDEPRALLVYLHGRYAEETTRDEMNRQLRLGRQASRRGYAVLALRGMQGQCTDPQLAAWWCWPSNERNAGDGPAFVARWAVALADAERRASPTRHVLLGFSNGGYFASLIASRALVPFDAIAVAHGGPVAPMRPAGARPPMLLVDADDDPSSPEVLHLASDLREAAWPYEMVIREGGHDLTDWDIDMALTFFDRTRTEELPLSPPLSPLRPPRPHDAGPTDPAFPSASASPSASAPAPPPASADPVLDPSP